MLSNGAFKRLIDSIDFAIECIFSDTGERVTETDLKNAITLLIIKRKIKAEKHETGNKD